MSPRSRCLRRIGAVVTLLLSVGCASGGGDGSPSEAGASVDSATAAAHRARDAKATRESERNSNRPELLPVASLYPNRHQDHAALPYTVERLRDDLTVGLIYRVRIEQHGQPIRYLEATITGKQEQGVSCETHELRDGVAVGDGHIVVQNYEQFISAASHPRAATTVDSVYHTTPAGEFACWRYHIERDSGSETIYFDQHRAGLPVDSIREVDSVQVFRVTLLERRVPATPSD